MEKSSAILIQYSTSQMLGAETYELKGDYGDNGSTNEVLFAKMDNRKVSGFTRTTTF